VTSHVDRLVAGAPTRAIVRTERLRKVYHEGGAPLPVLSGVDVTVDFGEIVALRGPSGSGKSTLLNILGCLDRPTSGRYFLGGRDVSTLDRTAQAWVRLHYIGFIFQTFHLISHSTALENVALPLHYAGVRRPEAHAEARRLLERVGLGHRLDHRPNQLSGGQRQRVAVARALSCKPRLILADEPTGALDTRTGQEILDLMLELHAEQNLTIVIVTHDPAIASVAHRQIEIRDGLVVGESRSDAPAA
jgi:putative ABC transport system ATP-binding protein